MGLACVQAGSFCCQSQTRHRCRASALDRADEDVRRRQVDEGRGAWKVIK